MPLESLRKEQLTNGIIQKAKDLGFIDCGISKAEHLPEDEKFMEQWLLDGNHGEMSYLEKNKNKRYDPRLLVENAASVISVLYNYFPENDLESADNYKISKYAYGKDYHYVIKEKLKLLDAFIKNKSDNHNSRRFVDSAPVLDRAWAKKSGLGFIGKNTMLINRKAGSFFFIGHIITELKLHYKDIPSSKNYCGNCTLCIDTCPTNAIKDGFVDARSCLSYLTIEYRGEIDKSIKQQADNWIFGCDICQDVCPWNRFSLPHKEPLFVPDENLKKMEKSDWESLDKSQFNLLFKGSAVQRTRFSGLKRNITFFKEDQT